jgi:hypothetical protein
MQDFISIGLPITLQKNKTETGPQIGLRLGF